MRWYLAQSPVEGPGGMRRVLEKTQSLACGCQNGHWPAVEYTAYKNLRELIWFRQAERSSRGDLRAAFNYSKQNQR